MILAGASALMMLMFGGMAAADPNYLQLAQVSVRQHIIVRVQRGARPPAPAGGTVVQWREGRGPNCVSARTVAGATLLGRESVDLIMHDNSRVRARLERGCAGLDYYNGFYVETAGDGRICADRDAVRSRMGGHCVIDQFRSLSARRP